MSRPIFPFVAGDISALARSLHRELGAHEGMPGHVELLNMLARAAGYRNFQHFRAQFAARERLEAAPGAPADPVDFGRVEKAMRYFDAEGRLAEWPAKASIQALCLWGLWSRLPAEGQFGEREFSERLQRMHGFGDHALLRRRLVDDGLVSRSPDGSDYRRIERQPGPEALALIRAIAAGAAG